jgi:hypothetical protein
MTWKSQLLIDEQYNERTANREEQYTTKRRHGSCHCSWMSSLMKELLIMSSIILISWHGSRNWDFHLIQLQGKQYVLAGVCCRLQEWILKVSLQSRKNINKSAKSMPLQEWTARRPGEPQDCNQAAQQECTAEQDTGVQWRSLSTMPIKGVTAINGDPSCGNIWITGVCWRYL